MPIELDHTVVPAKNRTNAAKLLAELLGVEWRDDLLGGHFAAVFVNEDLSIDFLNDDKPFLPYHFAFRVSAAEFDAIFARIKAAGIAYRSTPFGPMDMKIDERRGKNVYWNEPEGHHWEMLTVNYHRGSVGVTGTGRADIGEGPQAFRHKR